MMDRRAFMKLGGATVVATAATRARRAQASSLWPLPQIGTCANTVEEYDATRAAAAHPLTWDVMYQRTAEDFDVATATALAARGVTHIVLTLEMWLSGDYVLQRVAAGEHDANLHRVGAQMQAWARSHPWVDVMLRPLHEANGDWYPWCFGNGKRRNAMADFRPAWWHLHRVWAAVAPDVHLAWSPNIVPTSGPDTLAQWYPGNDHAFRVMPDGYNRSQSDGGWRTPEQLWDRTLRELRSFVPMDKPIVIGETATSEPGRNAGTHDKAEWMGDLGLWLRGPARDRHVEALCWFDRDLSATTNRNDWRADTSRESRDAFRAAVRGLP